MSLLGLILLIMIILLLLGAVWLGFRFVERFAGT